MRYTKENIVEGIHAKLEEMYGDSPMYKGFLKHMKQILPTYPTEVEQNVLEWLNGDEISDVDCHGISIKTVLSHPDAIANIDFPHVLYNFIKFQKSGFKNRLICFDGFVRL